MEQKETFWYMATPYTKYRAGLNRAYEAACYQAGLLLKEGVQVFSPIAHSHSVGSAPGFEKELTDRDFWMRSDLAIAAGAHGLIVVMLDGWKSSQGVKDEIAFFKGKGLPIIYMQPGMVPAELQPTVAPPRDEEKITLRRLVENQKTEIKRLEQAIDPMVDQISKMEKVLDTVRSLASSV